MNPEHSTINTLDRRKRKDNIEDTAELLLPLHTKIAPIMEKLATHPENFTELHDEETIARDLRYVQKRKAGFAETANNKSVGNLTEGEVRNLAEILEYQIIRGINVANWIPLCTAIKTSEYDDIYHGIDMVLTIDNPQNSESESATHLGLGVDISFSHNLHSKFKRIKNEIDHYDGEENGLGTVKYFHDRSKGVRRELHDLPRVVAALDVGVMEDLARAKDGGKGHIARHAIVTEMEHQLAVFADYAQKKNPLCLEPIMRAQDIVHKISLVTKSEDVLEGSGYAKNAKMQRAVEKGLSLFR